MPLFDFRCRACGHEFEALVRRVSYGDAPTTCTACGTGDTKSPLYISIASQVVVPVGLCTVLAMTRGLTAPDIWLAIVLGHATRASLSVWRFRQGKWRTIQIRTT